MEDLLPRLLENLVDRVDRPMALRFLLQPAMAIFFGIRDGLRFAREGRSFLLGADRKTPRNVGPNSWRRGDPSAKSSCSPSLWMPSVS
jgi:hypothetical protein